MHPLAAIRRVQAPLVCLVLACLVSVGCNTATERLSLDAPWKAYRAEDGTLMMGYYIQPKSVRDYDGWHWLAVEPDLAASVFEPVALDAINDPSQTILIAYEGWSADAQMVPKLTQPGATDPTPPKAFGALQEYDIDWDPERRAFRLVGSSGGVLPWARVSPDSTVLKTHKLNNRVSVALLQIAAVAGLVTGVVLLDGSFMFSTYGFSASF